MSQTSRAVLDHHLKGFQSRKDGIHRIPGGTASSMVICLREQGTKIEVRKIESGHVFYEAWLASGKKRIHFPFDPAKAYRFHARMKSAQRQLAVSVQRYLLKVYANEDVSNWCYPPRRERQDAVAALIPSASSTAA